MNPQTQDRTYRALYVLACTTLRQLARVAAVVLVIALSAGTVYAGRACEARPATPEAIRAGLALAHKVSVALDEARAETALIARIGQDLSRHGLTYSHAGIVLRDPERGGYTVVNLLNQCGTADSALYDDGLGTFFMDDLFRHEVLLIIPSQPAQARLRLAVTGGGCTRLHEPAYSVVAYPFATRYQNCNGWLAECIAHAEGAGRDRAQAQRWLQQQKFKPTTLTIGTLERLGGRLTAANVAFDDHPSAQRFASRIDVASVEAVFDFFDQRVDRGARRQIIN
jgi:hypothetical protein